jgi:hypothetical protein
MGERHWRWLPDGLVPNWCDHLVAGPEVLAPQSESELARGFSAYQWDLHSAIGFWCFPLVLVWGLSGFYFVFPQAFSVFFVIDPADRITDQWFFGFRNCILEGSICLRRGFGRYWV